MTNTVRDQVERVMASYRPTPLSQHDIDNARGPLPRYIHPTPLEWGEEGEPMPPAQAALILCLFLLVSALLVVVVWLWARQRIVWPA